MRLYIQAQARYLADTATKAEIATKRAAREPPLQSDKDEGPKLCGNRS